MLPSRSHRVHALGDPDLRVQPVELVLLHERLGAGAALIGGAILARALRHR